MGAIGGYWGLFAGLFAGFLIRLTGGAIQKILKAMVSCGSMQNASNYCCDEKTSAASLPNAGSDLSIVPFATQ